MTSTSVCGFFKIYIGVGELENGSVVKINCGSGRRPGLYSQIPHGRSHVISVPGHLMPSSDQAYMWCIYIYEGKILIYIKEENFFSFFFKNIYMLESLLSG